MRRKISAAVGIFVAALALQFTPLGSSVLHDAQFQFFDSTDNTAVLEFDAVDVRSQSSNESVALNDAFIFNRSSPLYGFALPFDDPDEGQVKSFFVNEALFLVIARVIY